MVSAKGIKKCFKRTGAKMMREKKRYLKIIVESEKKLGEEEAKHLIHESIFSMLGELGASQARVFLKEWNEKKQEGILVCNNEMVEEVVASLALKRFFKEKDVAIRLIKKSGTIKRINEVPQRPRPSTHN